LNNLSRLEAPAHCRAHVNSICVLRCQAGALLRQFVKRQFVGDKSSDLQQRGAEGSPDDWQE